MLERPLAQSPRAISGTYRVATVALLLTAGILAGTQFGKIAPLVDWYRDEIGMSLVAVGWLAALIGFFVAFAAFPSGLAIDRFGGLRIFVAASAVLTVGGLGLAVSHAPAIILGARLVEGIGYLFLVVVIPALAAEIAPPKFKGPALAVWGGFVPIGFAIGAFLSRPIVPGFAPETFLFVCVLAFAVLASMAALPLARVPEARRRVPSAASERLSIRRTLSPALMALAAAFGFYVMQSLAFFTFLPAYAQEAGARLALPAGAVALIVPFGNFLAGVLVGGRGIRFIAGLTGAAFLAGAIAAPPFYASHDVFVVTACAAVFALSGGIVASALFAAVPFIIPAGGSAAVAMGFVAQIGGIATLAAPPLAGFLVERFGWPALGWGVAAAGIAGLAAIAPLVRRSAFQ